MKLKFIPDKEMGWRHTNPDTPELREFLKESFEEVYQDDPTLSRARIKESMLSIIERDYTAYLDDWGAKDEENMIVCIEPEYGLGTIEFIISEVIV